MMLLGNVLDLEPINICKYVWAWLEILDINFGNTFNTLVILLNAFVGKI